ncbi:MAG TPA: tetratricopeptide repeat protein [Actinophytocola sp.]|nr:tetratricopeptide repeat protein [Actinophytocola sp.]
MSGSERTLLKWVKVGLPAACLWVLSAVVSEELAARAGDSWWGRVFGPLLLPVGTVVVVVGGGVALVRWWRKRRKEPPPKDPDPERPDYRLFGRRDELGRALDRVRRGNVVLLAGARDVGTSAVAEHVVKRLVDDRGGDWWRVCRFDLRSHSVSEPYDAVATAGRIVARFDLDPPSDDTDDVLAGTARRLLAGLPPMYEILFLDNVSTAEQVTWLVREWPSEGNRVLVVAGEPAVGDAARPSTVPVGELPASSLRKVWDAALAGERGAGQVADDLVAKLLAACMGRPRAVIDLAHEVERLSAGSSVAEVVEDIQRQLEESGPVEGPLERVWTVILGHIWVGLSKRADWLLRALAELPVTGITRAEVAAILDAHDPVVAGDEDPLEALKVRNLVQEQGGRIRVRQEIRSPIQRTDPDGRRGVAVEAVPALVRHLAALTEDKAGRLEVDPVGTKKWFNENELFLRPLFAEDSYRDTHRDDHQDTYREDDLIGLVFADLCVIADGLDSWYVRERQSPGLLEVGEGLHTLAKRVQRDDVAALAALRAATADRMAGRLGDARSWLDKASQATMSTHGRTRDQLETRERAERAFLAASGPEPVAESVVVEALAAFDEQRAAGRDLPGEAVALVNLGVLAIRAGLPDAALRRLREAERIARDARDAGCEAHSVELQGTALAMLDGQRAEAVRRWQRARTIFAGVGEKAGEARCLLNLGAMALQDARMAGLSLNGLPTRLSPRDAAREAHRLLEESKKLHTGQADTSRVDRYLDQARRELKS